MATSMGLAGRALVNQNPAMQVLTPEQVSAGLPLAAAAVAILGKAGGAAILVMLYLAVTSAVSAQLIAVSSVITFDVLPYVQSSPSKRTVSVVSHATIVLWAIFLGAISSGFNYAGVGMGSIYLWVGLLVAPAVGFVYACLVWKRANRTGALIGLATGFVLGITAWLVTCKTLYGELTVATLSMDYPVLAGNLVSILLPIIIILLSTWYAPDNYDWAETRAINAPVDSLEDSAPATPEKAESIACKEQDGMANEKGTVSVHKYHHVLRSGLE
jgi:Na+/proline symporter